MTSQQELIAQYKIAFDQFDKDKNGYLNKQQIFKMIKQVVCTASDQQIQQQTAEYLKQLDKNKDGKITFQQFCEDFLKVQSGK